MEVTEAFGWVRTGPSTNEMDANGNYVVCQDCLAEGVREMTETGPIEYKATD